jgi:peroxisomal 2,4-dienoyl-CoA reductase
VSRAALPHLKVHGGSLINISATLQYLATLGQVHASAAKAGVDVLTRTLAGEWGAYRVRVNGIAPGPTAETEGVRRLSTPESQARMLAQCPLGRLTAIEDIANAALFLVSDAAAFITGVTLVVDGGLWSTSDRLFQQD